MYSESYSKYRVGDHGFNELSADISDLYYLDVLKRKDISYYKSYLNCKSCLKNKKIFNERKRIVKIILGKIDYNRNILNNFKINCLDKRVYFQHLDNLDNLGRLLMNERVLSEYRKKGGISCLEIDGYFVEHIKGSGNKEYYYFSYKNEKINGFKIEELKNTLQIKINENLKYPKIEDVYFFNRVNKNRDRLRVYFGSHNDFSDKITLLEYNLTSERPVVSDVRKDTLFLDVIIIFVKG